MRTPLAIACCCFVLLCGRTAAAQGAPEDPLAGDPRLERKVSATVEGVPVGDLLSLLSEKSGVSLSASREVADDKVMLFGPARPLRELLGDLAALFNNRWTRKPGPDGAQRYLLLRDLRARQYEEGLAKAPIGRMLAKMDEQVGALDETPAQLARRPKEDLIRYRLSDPLGRLGTTLYGCLSRAQRETLFKRQHLHIPFEELNAQQKREIREAAAELTELQKQFDELLQAQGFNVGWLDPEILGKNGILFELWRASTVQVMVQLARRGGSLVTGLLDGRTRWLLPPHGNPYTGKPVPNGAKLPSLQALEAASTEPTWTDRLRRLAAESGQPVLADYYRCRPSLWQMDDSKVVVAGKAVAAVDAFCMPSSYLWWTCGRSLLLRKRDWYDLRRYEVPDRWLLASLARLEARNWVLTYGDLGRVAELTPEQIAGLTGMVGRGSSVQESDIPSLRALLALVAAAPAAEETPAYSGALYEEVLERITFTYPRLNPAQRRLALAVAEEEHWPIAPEQMPRFFARACFAYGEPIRKAGKERYMQIVVNWGFGDARRAVDEGHAGLHLPASFPDDRRDRTKVEIVP